MSSFPARYNGSIPEYRGRVGTATLEGEWTDRETARYTLVLQTGLPLESPAVLRNVRGSSLDTAITVVLD